MGGLENSFKANLFSEQKGRREGCNEQSGWEILKNKISGGLE